MKVIYKLLTVIVFFITCPAIQAQSSTGDRLFAQGQKLQMEQTVKSQNQAIDKFKNAKKAYDSKERKSMCDNQIKICEKNIETIKKKEKESKITTKKEVVVVEKTKEVQLPKRKDPVTLTLTESTIEFKSDGKKDDNHEVTVNCNYDDWTYTVPDWITATRNGNKLTLVANSANETDEERSAVVVVKCDEVRAELMTYQKSPNTVKKIWNKITKKKK